MVGDDEKDMISARLEMLTFYIEGQKKNIANHIPEPTYRGALADLKLIL